MPIKHAEPPRNGAQLISQHLADVIQGTPDHIHGAPDLFHVHVTEPHPGYHYGLDDLVARRSLDRARLGTWNYFVYDTVPEPEVLGVAHLLVNEDGSVDFHGMTSGPIVHAKVDAIIFAETHRHTASDHLELRAISIPAVSFAALWLHRKDVDRFLPLFTHHDGLEKKTFYTWNQVTEALHERAVAVQSQNTPL